MSDELTLTAVFLADESGWTMGQLVECPAVVTYAPTLPKARAQLRYAARELIAASHDQGHPDQIASLVVGLWRICTAASTSSLTGSWRQPGRRETCR